MPECPIARLSNRGGSGRDEDETRRDETRRDDARHGATRGMWYDEDEARAREEDYDELVRELVHVPDDVRNTLASFLQDLRRDGVDWYLVGNGDEFGLDFDDFQEERFFRQLAGPCARATRIPGSASLKFARENGAQWGRVYVCVCRACTEIWTCLKYAHENGCPWDEDTCERAA